MTKYLWMGLGWISVGLGVVGIFLPLVPTTPFLLLAAFAFSKGSERLHDWLLTHPKLGPPIHNWQQHGAVSRKIKVVASTAMLLLLVLSVAMGAPGWVIASQAVVLCGVALFLWSRPEQSGG